MGGSGVGGGGWAGGLARGEGWGVWGVRVDMRPGVGFVLNPNFGGWIEIAQQVGGGGTCLRWGV